MATRATQGVGAIATARFENRPITRGVVSPKPRRWASVRQAARTAVSVENSMPKHSLVPCLRGRDAQTGTASAASCPASCSRSSGSNASHGAGARTCCHIGLNSALSISAIIVTMPS